MRAARRVRFCCASHSEAATDQRLQVGMRERYLEDLQVGDRFESAPYEITEEAITEFAREFDPQPFHLDRDAASKSIFKGLVASGWHTAAITMRLLVTSGLNLAGGAIGRRQKLRSNQTGFTGFRDDEYRSGFITGNCCPDRKPSFSRSLSQRERRRKR